MEIQSALFVLALSGTSTFYVDPGGDNGNDGSTGAPWATIEHAVENVPDGSTILVRPGTYGGRTRLDVAFQSGVLVRSETPYAARLRHNDGAALICYTCSNITVEGFDIAHAPGNTGPLVVQIQDLLGSIAGSGDGTDPVVSGVTLRNNIIHSSTNNDLLKINNGVENIRIEGNMFFDQQGSDEHIDVNSVRNVTIEGNVFFNTTTQASTSSFVVIKDSNGASDSVVGTQDVVVARNIFANWQGNTGNSFVRIGEDGTANFEADGVLVENNLMLGNSGTRMRSAFSVMGSTNVIFRNNTISGDLPANSYAARLFTFGDNQPNENIRFYNNIWSDPTGTMGTEADLTADFMESPVSQNGQLEISHNVYFNGGNGIPADSDQALQASDDANGLTEDPGLPNPATVQVPIWNGSTFADGSISIAEAFAALAAFAEPTAAMVVDNADPANAPTVDLLGNSRIDGAPDRGAIELPDPDMVFADGFESP